VCTEELGRFLHLPVELATRISQKDILIFIEEQRGLCKIYTAWEIFLIPRDRILTINSQVDVE